MRHLPHKTARWRTRRCRLPAESLARPPHWQVWVARVGRPRGRRVHRVLLPRPGGHDRRV
eukprot:730843-Prymnesium_polylepis.1